MASPCRCCRAIRAGIDVKELVFALEFRGRAGAVAGVEGKRRSRSVAPSQALSSVMTAAAVEGGVERLTGDEAVLEAEVSIVDESTFTETGTIRYGQAGGITFATLGHHHVQLRRQPGRQSRRQSLRPHLPATLKRRRRFTKSRCEAARADGCG